MQLFSQLKTIKNQLACRDGAPVNKRHEIRCKISSYFRQFPSGTFDFLAPNSDLLLGVENLFKSSIEDFWL